MHLLSCCIQNVHKRTNETWFWGPIPKLCLQMPEMKILCSKKKPFKDTQCADCVNSSLLVDALIVTKIRGIKRRNTENVLNSLCPLGEKDKSPSAQNDLGISRRLEWDEKDTGKSEVITDHNHDCIFRNCKKCSAINTLQESIIKQNPEVDWSKQVTWH